MAQDAVGDHRSAQEHFDVVIVGAGLSGIGAGYHLQTQAPGKSYVILEGRETIGGTWDLFRYPGIRSDSDMFTLGYRFKPWRERKAIADGATILNYVRETAAENGIDKHIRFKTRVTGASWSSDTARWTVTIKRPSARGDGTETAEITCGFLFLCAGYYKYEQGYTPEFPGIERFKGRIVHPQKWTSDIDYAGKRIVVIGSGATAVTLIPELAKTAAHVAMLQRSPTYVVARPEEDELANKLRRNLPAKTAYWMIRWRNVLRGAYIYRLCKRDPAKVKGLILGAARMELGPDYDIGKHFTPRYNPWDQRLCLAPNGDMFKAIRSGAASVVTDEIVTFNETGIKLKSGEQLDADIIVTATGLQMQVLGGMSVSVDGREIEPAKTLNYKGLMYSDIPNFASCFGYTNASWTLKCDLTCEYVCRLLNHMSRNGYDYCVPHNADENIGREPWVGLTSGYIQRNVDKMPGQGTKHPWRLYQNYPLDIMMLRYGRLDDGVLLFRHRGERPPAARRVGVDAVTHKAIAAE